MKLQYCLPTRLVRLTFAMIVPLRSRARRQECYGGDCDDLTTLSRQMRQVPTATWFQPALKTGPLPSAWPNIPLSQGSPMKRPTFFHDPVRLILVYNLSCCHNGLCSDRKLTITCGCIVRCVLLRSGAGLPPRYSPPSLRLPLSPTLPD